MPQAQEGSCKAWYEASLSRLLLIVAILGIALGLASLVSWHASLRHLRRQQLAALIQVEPASQEHAACLGELFSELQLDDLGPWQDTTQQCIHLAAEEVQPEPQFLAQFQPHSRTLPPAQPALSAYDWAGPVLTQPPPGWPNASPDNCHTHASVIRVKIYRGVLYAHAPHNSTTFEHRFWKTYREACYEMLLAVLWLYEDVPDMEFAINPVDRPLHCHWTIPFLQFAVVNLTSPSSGAKLDIDPLEYACPHQGKAAPGCHGYTRGFTVPVPDAWAQLSLSPRQLLWYSYCLHQRYVHSIGTPGTVCNVPRLPQVFWRGSATGTSLGWSASGATARSERFQDPETQFFTSALFNKRISLALIASKYPWMNVGLTRLHPEEMLGYHSSPHNSAIAQMLNQSVVGDRLDIEQWTQYHLVMNLDGHGPAFRLARLLLGTVPVVKVESILREWFIDHALPDVHYESVKFDLSDVAVRTQQLLHEAQHDNQRLERMALAAVQLGTQRFNALAQIESVAWSLARIKAACNWTVLPPGAGAASPAAADSPATGSPVSPAQPQWYVVKLREDRNWQNKVLYRFRRHIINALADNFEHGAEE